MSNRDVTRLDDSAGAAWPHRGGRARYFLAYGLIGVAVTAFVVGYGEHGKVSRDKGGELQGLKGGGGGQGGASPVASQLLEGGGGLLRMDRCKDLAARSGGFDALRCRCALMASAVEALACHLEYARELSSTELKAVASPPPGKSAMDHTRTILSFGSRTPGRPGWEKTQEYITGTMRGLGWVVEEDKFEADTPLGKVAMRNVIASFHPEGGECIVDVSAHLDSKYEPHYEFLGATDSAAPVGMMLAAAQVLTPALQTHLAAAGDMPCLRMVFFDGEEAYAEWSDTDSTYGARHLAAEWAKSPARFGEGASRLASMRTLMLLDLLGNPRPSLTWQFGNTKPLFARMQSVEQRMRVLKLVVAEGAAGGALLTSGTATTEQRGTISDDHLPFLHLGIPILHLIAAPFPAVWHTERDNLSALDPSTVNALGAILTATLAEIYALNL